MHAFFQKAGEMLFGSPETKKASKKQTRTLRIEELEPRELLSVTPLDWDWWNNVAANSLQTDSLPAGYNTDSNSDDFGKMSIGGNNAQMDATSAFAPAVTSDFLAFNTVTRQGDITTLDGNDLLPVGSYVETITVGIFAQDLGNGNWSYTEIAAYTYDLTSASGDYSYADGYSYVLSASFINGIYSSAFTLTTGYGYTDTIDFETDTDDFTFSWTVTLEYSITDTITFTYSHNTLTSEQNASDTRTTCERLFYEEHEFYQYNTSDYFVKETFDLLAMSITDTFVTVLFVDTGNGWVVGGGYASDHFYYLYNYTETYLETFSEEGLDFYMKDDRWSNSESDTNVYYLWDSGAWNTIGMATTTDGFGYDWEVTWDITHATGMLYDSVGSFHDESVSVDWVYDNITGMWMATSSDGGGGGVYFDTYYWDSTTSYERVFYDSIIEGTGYAYIDYQCDENWDVSFRTISGQVIRETEGDYTATYEHGTSFSGGGSHSENRDTTTPGTMSIDYHVYSGLYTAHFEREASLTESGLQSYSETITGEWSNKVNEQGQLVRKSSADAEVTFTAEGSYETSLYEYSWSQFDGDYDNTSSCSYSNGCYFSYSDNETLTEVSEHYTSELTENWHSDGGAFYRVSFNGSANGGGSYNAPRSSNNNSEKYNEWGYSDYGYGYGCGCGYDYYNYDRYDSFSESCREIAYDYTANWSWGANSVASANVVNHTTGNAGGTLTRSWSCASGSDYSYGSGCGCSYHYSCSDSCSYDYDYYCGYSSGYSCSYGCGCGYGCSTENYDEVISRTGWGNDETVVPPFYVRWSPFSGSVDDSCGNGNSCGCGSGYGCDYGCGCDYSYRSAYFSAPNFTISLFLTDDANTGGDCFVAGTQVVVGAEFTENDVLVQYVTMNIEDIKVGDLVYSYDTITGEVEQKEVTAIFVREIDHINYLTILDEHGNEQVIATTDSHPFWVVTDEPDLSRAAREVVDENGVWLYHENVAPTENGFWVEAKDLREGDVFIGANGELSTLVSKERVEFEENIKVYNFTVEGNHNYFVLAETDEYGQTSVLVHNAETKRTWTQWRQEWMEWFGVTQPP